MLAEGIVEFGIQLDLDPPPDHMMIHDEPRVERGPQNNLARGGVGIQRIAVLGFEQKARNLERRHDRSVAQQGRALVDQAGIGQAVAGAGFLRAPGGSSDPLAHNRIDPFQVITPRSCCSPSV